MSGLDRHISIEFGTLYMIVNCVLRLFGLCFNRRCIGLGVSIYMTADMGVSTYDAVAITMADKWKLSQFKYLRIGTDFACVTLGILCFIVGGGKWSELGIVAGVGTMLTAFCMGPMINFFNIKVSRPFLER